MACHDGSMGSKVSNPAAFVREDSAVPDGLLAPGWDVVECGREEIGGFEDFEVSLEKRTRSVRLMKIAIPESGRANAAKGFDIRRLPCR
jgi:hypothetical protein